MHSWDRIHETVAIDHEEQCRMPGAAIRATAALGKIFVGKKAHFSLRSEYTFYAFKVSRA